MRKLFGDSRRGGVAEVTMWIPTPSMTRTQRVVLYGTCFMALVNTVGILVLLVQQNQQRVHLEQTASRLTEVEQSSVVEFLQEVPRGAAGLRASMGDQHQYQYQYQYSRNKRSEELEKELVAELKQLKELKKEDGQGLQQETSQAVGEEMGRKMRHELKHKHKLTHGQHEAEVVDDMMVMMTYSMVPVRQRDRK